MVIRIVVRTSEPQRWKQSHGGGSSCSNCVALDGHVIGCIVLDLRRKSYCYLLSKLYV